MGLRISFKRGMKQSQQAAQYFRHVVNGFVQEMLDGMQPFAYLISSSLGPSLHLRVWSRASLQQKELHDLMELLMNLRDQVHALQEGPAGRQRVAQLASDWLRERMGGADLYVEVSVDYPAKGIQDKCEFTLAIIHGRCAMISTETCLFTWLEQDMFGLTLAGHGSYLMEMVPDQDQHLREAS